MKLPRLSQISSFVRQFPRLLWLLALGWFVGAFGFAASMPFVSVYCARHLGMSLTDIAILFLVMAIARASFQTLAGELSDRMSRKKLLVHSQYLRAISFVALGYAIYKEAGIWWISSLLFITTIFGAAFFPIINALVSDILPKEQRLDGYAITRSAGNLGWALGPAFGGFLAVDSYAMVFYLSAFIILISSFIFSRYLNVKTQEINQSKFKLRDIKIVFDNKLLAMHMILSFFLYLVHLQLVVPFAVYTTSITKAVNEIGLGQLYLINGMLVVLFQVPLTRFLSRYKLTTQLTIGGILYFIGYGSIGFYSTFGYFAMVIVVVSLAELFISPPSMVMVSRFAPEGQIGRYMGLHSFFVTLGFSLAPLYGNYLIAYIPNSHATAWLIIASAGLLAGFGYLNLKKKLPDAINRSNFEAEKI